MKKGTVINIILIIALLTGFTLIIVNFLSVKTQQNKPVTIIDSCLHIVNGDTVGYTKYSVTSYPPKRIKKTELKEITEKEGWTYVGDLAPGESVKIPVEYVKMDSNNVTWSDSENSVVGMYVEEKSWEKRFAKHDRWRDSMALNDTCYIIVKDLLVDTCNTILMIVGYEVIWPPDVTLTRGKAKRTYRQAL